MRDKKLFYNEKTILVFIFFLFLIFFYGVLYYLNWDLVRSYDDTILPGFYVDDYDISGLTFDHAEKKIELLSNDVLRRNILIGASSKEFSYSLADLGIEINVSKTMKEVLKYQKHLSFSRKLWFINQHVEKKSFPIYYEINQDVTVSFLNDLNRSVGFAPQNGYFDTSEGVRYVSGVDGFEINIEESLAYIKKIFQNSNMSEEKIYLFGNSIPAYTNESYRGIDTMTSSFVTEYDTWITARAKNLRTAIQYINGAIVEPGDVFSYYQYAGPYDKSGYVFYYEFVGNGVCQVATTVYNAALLGGHEIVTRSPHAKKSPYVAGGLDATVVSYSNGWNVDMQWRNTYDYPVYVKAYDYDGEVHVELWSNSNAKGGKTYSLESVWLGGRGYATYRHTYLDGEEIDVSHVATTWYPED